MDDEAVEDAVVFEFTLAGGVQTDFAMEGRWRSGGNVVCTGRTVTGFARGCHSWPSLA